MLTGLLIVALTSGCASKVGWSMTEQRTCEPKAAAHVCSVPGPDYGHVLELADTELLPGECAVVGADPRGGWVRVDTRDPRGEGRGRWVRAPRAKVTVLELSQDGRVSVANRLSCDRSPITLD